MNMLWTLAAIVSLASAASQAAGMESQMYKPSSMAEAIADTPVVPDAVSTLDSARRRYRVNVHFAGQRRVLSEDNRELLLEWREYLGDAAAKAAAERITDEVAIRDDTDIYWMLTSRPIAERLEREVGPEGPTTLFILYIGALGTQRVFAVEQVGTEQHGPDR